MKIALLLPGLTRSATLCFDNLNKHLLSKHDVDIFISTWDIPSESTINDIKRLYNPNKIIVDNYSDHIDMFENKISNYSKIRNTTPDRSVSAFYKIKSVFDIVGDGYDVYVKSRLDIMLESDFNINRVSKNTIYIPSAVGKPTKFENGYYKSYVDDSYGIIDTIAYGDYDTMKEYCGLYDRLDSLCIYHKYDFHPEYLTLKNIQHSKLNIDRFYLDYFLYRKPN